MRNWVRGLLIGVATALSGVILALTPAGSTLAFVVLFHPDFAYAAGAAVVVAVLLPLGVLRHRVVAGAMAPDSMAEVRAAR